ncbi:g6549 [Coccomyxa elongata]
MAPKDKLLKGQRPISSFFFAKPAKTAGKRTIQQANAGAVDSSGNDRQATPKSATAKANDAQDSGQPPQKRQRTTDSGLRDHHASGSHAARPATEAGEGIVEDDDVRDLDQSAPAEGGAPKADADVYCSVDVRCASATDIQQTRASARSTAPSYNAQAQHERFQNKLVLGPASGLQKRGSAADIVPQKRTPLEDQVYELKRKHPGVLLAIEVGYKFRFFGEDAEIAARECNIFCYPDRNFMTSSIPVPRLHVYVRRLVEAGYKVGIVQQTETAALKKAGDNRNAPFTRQLTALYTRATLEAGDKDHVGEGRGSTFSSETGTAAWTNEGLSSYLVCVVESTADNAPQGAVDLGMVAIETSTGDILYNQFRDSMMRTELEARLVFAAPSELLITTPLSSASQRLLGAYTSQSHGLRSQTVLRERYSSGGAVAALSTFYTHAGCQEGALDTVLALPHLVIEALAFAIDFLKPYGMEAVLRMSASFRPFNTQHEMSLSPNTLSQLELLHNNDDGKERGSLLWLLDHTQTPFGSRLLRSWVAHPLRDAGRIAERLDAVEELAQAIGGMEGMAGRVVEALSGLGDLERGITRSLHGTASPAEFSNMLHALSTVAPKLGVRADVDLSSDAALQDLASSLLQHLFRAAASKEVSEAAFDLLSVMDSEAASANNKIDLFISEERFPEVFEARQAVADADATLVNLLPVLRKALRLPRLDYVSVQNQGDFLIEVPAERKDVPREWEKVSGTKKVNRYRPPEVRAALTELELARERLQLAADQAWKAFMQDFGSLYPHFRAAVQALASLDALQSLASLAIMPDYVRPEIVGDEEQPQLVIKGGRHPVLAALTAEGQVVPNDTLLRGDSGPRACIITGPNMGGKSCYIRQAALIAIMAQVGSFVPAESARMHVFDSVHTRMGASDNLAMGRSTFLEELSETSSILARATPRSLVIIDELGRGTATHDGLAIAHASLQHLITSTRCLTLFVTHYPKVASLEQDYPALVSTFYMSYIQQDPDTSEILPGSSQEPHRGTGHDALQALPSTHASVDVVAASSAEQPVVSVPRITFLYKLAPGIADKSFGLNVARMAHLPQSVIEQAEIRAAQMESDTLRRLSGARQHTAANSQKASSDHGKDAEMSLLKEIASAMACKEAMTLPAVHDLQRRVKNAHML